jgi:hypothetical protein
MARDLPSAPIAMICEAHLARDPIGPLITLVAGHWAYCAQNATAGHRWRRTAPIDRTFLESLPDEVRLICDDGPHLQHGRGVPNGDGMLTVADGKWAYCTAGLNKEPHHWVTIEPKDSLAIDHVELAERFEGRR